MNILSILEIDRVSDGSVFFVFPAAVGSRLTRGLFLWPFDFGLDLVATENPFLPLSLPIYFSLLGEG